MMLLDTNVLSELMRESPEPSVVAWLDERPGSDFSISSVTRAEIELGIALLPDGRRKQALHEAASRLFEAFHGRCVSFDESAASRYAELVAARIRAGRPITVEDAQTAAMAVAGGFDLVTRNVGDFEGIEGLVVVDPWAVSPPTSHGSPTPSQ